MKINLSLDTSLLEKIDKYCKEFNYERSEFIRSCIRKELFKEVVLEEADKKFPDTEKVENYMPPVSDYVKPAKPLVIKGSNLSEQTMEEFIDDYGNKYLFKTMEGWCQGHFERGKNYKRYMITYEDENGNITIDHKWYCKTCLIQLTNRRVGKIYDGREHETAIAE